VGPEIILRLFAQEGDFRALSERCGVGVVPFVVGEARLLEETTRIPEVRRTVQADAGAAGFDLAVQALATPPSEPPSPGVIPIVESPDFRFEGAPTIGKVSARCGAAAWAYVRHAVALVQSGAADAVVTAPLHKEALRAAGCPYPGHTEMLADLAGGVPAAMLLVGGGLRAALVTIHEPLALVPLLLSAEKILWRLRLMDTFIPWFGLRPRPEGGRVRIGGERVRPGGGHVRIGVCGLNPHAGEGGIFGREEGDIIAPAIAQARAEGIEAIGPLPADTAFHFHREGLYDAILAMYHDQALIPVKTLAFHQGVNVTMGLPFIRTSVDHGTAFDIAGKGVARPDSLRAALECAAVLARNRRAMASPG
jgi:4-hydroxythreonine-4-phosphate dehydrogenase